MPFVNMVGRIRLEIYLWRDLFHDLVDVRHEAHVQHTVCFIQDEKAKLVQLHMSLVQELE